MREIYIGLIFIIIMLLISQSLSFKIIIQGKVIKRRLEEKFNKISNVNVEKELIYSELDSQYKECTLKEQELKNLAFRDSLTGLPNRYKCMESIKNYIECCNNENENGAVLLMDLDNFKSINDTLGHNYGDQLLIVLSESLKLVLPAHWSLYRWGGDEFVIIVSNIDDKHDIICVLDDVYKMLKNPFEVGEKLLYLTISIGVDIFSKCGNDSNDILKNADKAMYKAKSSGKNRYQFYTVELHEDMSLALQIEKNLKTALLNNEMKIVYQPQVNLKQGKIVGLEALLRWTNFELGEISPTKFIPIAEVTGDIIPIGKWVIKEVCIQNMKWLNSGFINTVAVNVSPIQFIDENFYDNIEEVIFETGLPAELLEIEITENVLIKSYEKNIEIINKLRKIGVKVSLDDFGTGYSSLSYLRVLPINNLKIDKSFMDDLFENNRSKEIVDGIIQLAHKINLKVIAEGVETKEQLDFLNAIDCDVIQGYYFSKPKLSCDIEKDYIKC